MPLIVPVDVAVCDPDLMWRVDHMNAARSVNVRDFNTVMDAADELTPEHPSVILIGPNGLDLTFEDLRAVGPEHPEWKTAFVIEQDDEALVEKVRAAGAALIIDRAGEPETVAEMAIGLLSVDRDAVAADEAEAEALKIEGSWRDHAVSAAELVIVTSPKGGEGVTTVAANLARALASNGVWRVALVEGDSAFGDLTLLLDLPEPVRYDIDQIQVVDPEVVSRLTVTESESGLHVVRAPLGWRVADLPVDFAIDLLSVVAQQHDVVVLDGPFSLARERRIRAHAASVLLVATRRTASIKNALIAARVLGRPHNLSIVLNETSKRQREDPSRQAEEALGVEVIASLPYESQLDRSGATAAPHVLAPPRSHFSHALDELARGLRSNRFGPGRVEHL